MTIKDIIVKYSKELEEISPTPRLDVETLLQKVLGVDRLYILLNLERVLSEDEEQLFNKFINERLNNRPIAYIVGNREFMGLDFFVKEGVLIPRPDTEVLVEEVIELAKKKDAKNILDIGTGSGAITVSLAKYLENVKVTSVDISDIALEIGKRNAISNEVDDRINFVKSDLFTNIDKETKFDIIVSNPPYIKKSDIKLLSNEVQKEPQIALDGGYDGLDFYRKISSQAIDYLKFGSYLCFEIGYDQQEDVTEIIKDSKHYNDTYCKKDLFGNDRVIVTRVN